MGACLNEMESPFSLRGFVQENIILRGDCEECTSSMPPATRSRTTLMP